MNRRTMLLGTIGAAVGAALPAVAPAAPFKTFTACGPGRYIATSDDREMLAAYRRMLAELEAYNLQIKVAKRALERLS